MGLAQLQPVAGGMLAGLIGHAVAQSTGVLRERQRRRDRGSGVAYIARAAVGLGVRAFWPGYLLEPQLVGMHEGSGGWSG